ncbi:MAG: signal peptidase II, partial [Actinobacteria bacterium]|nr:signal peptidase II [Actinomycetota bacterium]
QDHGWILAIVVSLVTVAVAALLARGPRQLAVALGVFLGGSLGNLIDRLRLGYVVDFIGIAWWPTFNVADIALAVGAALIVLGFLRPRSS